MLKDIVHCAIVVRDYDEAIDFYIKKIGFVLIEDTILSSTKRWVLLAPAKSSNFKILLAKAVGKDQIRAIGNQTGGRVFMFLETTDFDHDYNILLKNEVTFVRQPAQEIYGKVAVFKDLYGNLWDLIEYS